MAVTLGSEPSARKGVGVQLSPSARKWGCMAGHSMEVVYQIWNDRDGCRIEVGPDRDCLGLIEIREYQKEGTVSRRITMPAGAAVLLADALRNAVENNKKEVT